MTTYHKTGRELHIPKHKPAQNNTNAKISNTFTIYGGAINKPWVTGYDRLNDEPLYQNFGQQDQVCTLLRLLDGKTYDGTADLPASGNWKKSSSGGTQYPVNFLNTSVTLPDSTKLYSFNHELPIKLDSTNNWDNTTIRFGSYQSYEDHGSYNDQRDIFDRVLIKNHTTFSGNPERIGTSTWSSFKVDEVTIDQPLAGTSGVGLLGADGFYGLYGKCLTYVQNEYNGITGPNLSGDGTHIICVKIEKNQTITYPLAGGNATNRTITNASGLKPYNVYVNTKQTAFASDASIQIEVDGSVVSTETGMSGVYNWLDTNKTTYLVDGDSDATDWLTRTGTTSIIRSHKKITVLLNESSYKIGKIKSNCVIKLINTSNNNETTVLNNDDYYYFDSNNNNLCLIEIGYWFMRKMVRSLDGGDGQTIVCYPTRPHATNESSYQDPADALTKRNNQDITNYMDPDRQINPPEDVSAFQTRVNSWKVDGIYKFKGNYWAFDDLSDSEYLIATEYVKHENDYINIWKDLSGNNNHAVSRYNDIARKIDSTPQTTAIRNHFYGFTMGGFNMRTVFLVCNVQVHNYINDGVQTALLDFRAHDVQGSTRFTGGPHDNMYYINQTRLWLFNDYNAAGAGVEGESNVPGKVGKIFVNGETKVPHDRAVPTTQKMILVGLCGDHTHAWNDSDDTVGQNTITYGDPTIENFDSALGRRMPQAARALTIGGDKGTVGMGPSLIDLHEVVIYDDKKSDADVYEIIKYLNKKWEVYETSSGDDYTPASSGQYSAGGASTPIQTNLVSHLDARIADGYVIVNNYANINVINSAFVKDSNITYTLAETMTSGTIVFEHASGTADSSAPHTITLSGDQLQTGATRELGSSSKPTLVDGAVYNIKFNGNISESRTAVEVVITNVTIDTTAPDILNILPTQDSFISSADVGYELSENLASGKVKFINTTDNTEEEINLTGSELNAGQKTLGALTNVPTLTHGKTYTIEINGTDLAGNNAVTQSVTGLKYEVPSSKLDSLTIPKLHGFAFDSTTENYNNITYNGDSINVTYQAKSNNVTITVEDANSNDISSNLSPLTLSDGDNVVKIIVTSNFSGTAAKTYTVTVNKPTAVDKVNNSLVDAGLHSPTGDDATAVNSLSSDDAKDFYSSNDTVNELPNSVKTAIQAVADDRKKVKALMQKILLECAINSKTIDINKPIELPIETFGFATANLPDNAPAKISVIPPSSQAISLDTSTNAIYVPLSVGEEMDFKLTYPTVTDSNLPNTQTINNYNIKFSSLTNTQFTFTLPAELEAYTTVDGAVYNSSNHSTVNNDAVVNINGNVIIIGSVLFGGNDGSGTSDPYAISSADQAVLTTGLDAISEETGRGNLKIKALNATMNAKLKELIVDSSDSAEAKRKKRDNALYIILNHANMGSSTAIKVPKSDLGFTEMSENALHIVVFKTSSSATVLDITGLNNDEAFYAPLSKNSQFSIDLGGGSVPTFVRADEVTEKYTLTVTGTPKLIKKTGCNDLVIDSNNNLVGGHLVPGDVVQIANRIFFMGMLGDGGQSIILEYANVAWTNVYDPNTTSFEDNVAAANPTVPLQPYNREITIDGVVIPAGALKFVKFGNGSTTVNFSN